MRAVVLAALLVLPSVARAAPRSHVVPDRDDRGSVARKLGVGIGATGAVLIFAGAIGGLVSAASVGPCGGNGTCGQESTFGRVAVPIIVGTGAALGVAGVATAAVAGRGGLGLGPRVLPVPLVTRDRVGLGVTGVF